MVQSDLEVPAVGYTEVLPCSFPIQMALIKKKYPYNFSEDKLPAC